MDRAPGVDSVWVRLGESGGSLPFLFKVSLQGGALPPPPSSLVFHPFGWHLGLPHFLGSRATVCPGVQVELPAFLPCLFLAPHASPRHLYLVFLPTLEQIAFRVSGLLELCVKATGVSLLGQNAFWPLLLFRRMVSRLLVPGKRCLEI